MSEEVVLFKVNNKNKIQEYSYLKGAFFNSASSKKDSEADV